MINLFGFVPGLIQFFINLFKVFITYLCILCCIKCKDKCIEDNNDDNNNEPVISSPTPLISKNNHHPVLEAYEDKILNKINSSD